MTAPVLELVDVSVPFGDEGSHTGERGPDTEGRPPGLRDVSLRLEAGERFALLGTSGAGKSSLLRAIAEPHSGVTGTIRVAGRDVRTTPSREREALLLDQRPLLFPHLDVRSNVAFPLEVRGIGGDRLEADVTRALEAVRMLDLAHRRPDSLSGGQAHRVALARAIAADPALLLLDEPFTGLDPELRTTLQETVVRVAADRGLATLTVTHAPEEAGRIADRIGVLADGRLVRVAPPAELFLDPGSEQVARLLGWRNLIDAELVDGRVRLPDGSTWPLQRAPSHGALPTGRGRLAFPAEGARLVEAAGDAVRVRITRVTRSPSGAVAHWTMDPRGAAASSVGDETEPVTGEVSVDPLASPEPGDHMGLELRRDRVRFYPHDRRPDE